MDSSPKAMDLPKLTSVKFNQPKNETHPTKVAVITRLVERASLYINLPDAIIVELQHLGNSVYGETVLKPTNGQKNKIRLNVDLSESELVIPTVHELIHLTQIYTGRLTISRFGAIVWEGKAYPVNEDISYTEYLKLPWEEDVLNTQNELIKRILNVVG